MLFSIITVTYNNLGGLQKTCKSLAEQSFQGFEFLVIDGKSQDGTVEFLESIQAPYISEPDKGIYDAMNKGIRRAEGFYVLFLNAGDCLADKDVLKNLAHYIEGLQTTPDFIYGDSLEERPDETEPAYKPARPYKKSAYGMFTHHQAMLYRTELVGKLRYDILYEIAADYKFTLQFLENANAVVYWPSPICLFEHGGISQNKVALGREEQFKIRQELHTVPFIFNLFIALQQKIVWTLRSKFPNLYWILKSKT